MSATTLTAQAVAVLGALGLGSILGQYIGASKDRRASRADVLSALANTEADRWVGPDKPSWGEFQTSMRKFQTAALIARLPREAVWEYGVLAQAARWCSQESWEQTGDPDTGGGVDVHLSSATREAARTIAVIAWSWGPTHTWRWRRAKKRINEHLTKLQGPETRNALQRSRDHGFM
jgi:hypothetical protein